MALTKDERRALELARKKIAGGKSTALCLALWSVEKECEELSAEVDRLIKYIQRALSPYFMLSTWQGEMLGQTRWDSGRVDRLAWIDWMLGKPLPGEAVSLVWEESEHCCVEVTEYCGRSFKRVWAEWQKRWFIFELIGKDNNFEYADFIKTITLSLTSKAEIDAAIVAHVWPAEKSEVV